MTDHIKTGGPAFPVADTSACKVGTVDELDAVARGMTLRDYFAAKAMQAIMSGPEWQLLQMKDIAANNDGDVEGVIAHFSYKMADAMLKEREANP